MEKAIRFFFELELLKEMQRTGWYFIGERDGDTVASHCFRAAFIAHWLARKIGADPEKCMKMALIHDIGETRVWDINKVSAGYTEKAESKAAKDAMRGSFDVFEALYDETREKKTKDALIVKDADLLECIMQAKTFVMRGNPLAMEWIVNASRALHFNESKEMAAKIAKNDKVWWEGLKRL
jgi:putative hydrolase of HD superfamily